MGISTIYFKTGGDDDNRKVETDIGFTRRPHSPLFKYRTPTVTEYGSELIPSNTTLGLSKFKLEVDTPVGGSEVERVIVCRFNQAWYQYLAVWETAAALGVAQDLVHNWTFRYTCKYDNGAGHTGDPQLKCQVVKFNGTATNLFYNQIEIESTSYSDQYELQVPSGSIATGDKLRFVFYGGYFDPIPP